uniref:Uncharacterized protein n=1 Tax=Zooxanthella nutricula TaxID=1333877 RepID=A0A7S2QB03_9DINO
MRPQYGLDIARSKSIMSQMITELKQLNEGAGAFRGQLIELVQALHDMRLNSRDMVEDVETGVSAFSPDESPKFRKLRHSLAPPAVASTDSREPPARGSQSSVSVPDDDGEISGDDDRGRALGMSLHDIRQELAGSISLQGQHASEHRPPLIVVGQTTVDEANEKLQHQIDKIMNHIERKLATAGLPTETVRDILSEFQAASGEEHDDDDDCSITSRDSLEAESICSAEKSWE